MPDFEMTIGKKFTLNTQNFSSISPSLLIKISNGNVGEIIKFHELLDELADGLFHKQIESDAKTMAIIKKLGFHEYFKKIRENGDIDEKIEITLEEINNLLKLPF